MAKEWANKDKCHPSNGVLEPRVQMPMAKEIVRTVPGGAASQATPVRLVHYTGQTGADLSRQGSVFRAREEAWFGSGGRGFGGWFAGGQLARRSPPHAQYEGGRSRSFEMEMRNGPWSSFRGFRPPLAREGWFPCSGYCGGVRGDSFDRRDAMICANPTLEQMVRHWFYSFGTNPSAKSREHF
jgi:hypothetical protein